MRSSVLVAFCLATVTGLAVLAAEKPPAEYQSAMKAIGGAQMSLRGNVSAKNYEGIARDAAIMKASFATIEQFWTARKTDDATGLAKAALKGATDLEAAANAKNDEGITAAQRAVMTTCMGCHTAHRERLPDGTYEIK